MISERVDEIAEALRQDGATVDGVAKQFGVEPSTVEWYLKYSLPCLTDFERNRKLHKRQCRAHLQDLAREHRGTAVALLQRDSAVGNRQSAVAKPTADCRLPTAPLLPGDR